MLSTLNTVVSSSSNQLEAARLDIGAVFERVYKMLEESDVKPNVASQPTLNTRAKEITNDAASEMSLEDILSLDEDWLYCDNRSNQDNFTDGSDGEAVQEYYTGSYSSLEYEAISESDLTMSEMIDFSDNYDSKGSETIHEYNTINQQSVWVSENDKYYYAYSNREKGPFIEQFTCAICNWNYCDQFIHQRFHEIAEELINDRPVICSICNAAYTNKEQHLRFHEIASNYVTWWPALFLNFMDI